MVILGPDHNLNYGIRNTKILCVNLESTTKDFVFRVDRAGLDLSISSASIPAYSAVEIGLTVRNTGVIYQISAEDVSDALNCDSCSLGTTARAAQLTLTQVQTALINKIKQIQPVEYNSAFFVFAEKYFERPARKNREFTINFVQESRGSFVKSKIAIFQILIQYVSGAILSDADLINEELNNQIDQAPGLISVYVDNIISLPSPENGITELQITVVTEYYSN